MYYYASKLSAIACGTRCKQAILQKNRGQRDRDKLRRMRVNQGNDDDDIDSDDIDCDLKVSTFRPGLYHIFVWNIIVGASNQKWSKCQL